MNQRQLNREVARATGESVSTIASLGFVPLTGGPVEHEPPMAAARQSQLGRSLKLDTVSRKHRHPRVA